MKDFFNKNSTRKGGKKFDGGKKFGGSGAWKRDDDYGARPSMHRATCSKCSAPCEVPFKPNGKKPIYCNDCFRKEDGGPRKSSFEKPAFRSTPRVSAPRADNDEVVKQLKALNVKIDQLLRALIGNEGETSAEGFSLPGVGEDEEEDDEDEE